MEEGTCGDAHWILHLTSESLNTASMTNYVLYSGQLNTQEKYLLSEIVYVEVYGFIHIDILIFLLCEISAYLK